MFLDTSPWHFVIVKALESANPCKLNFVSLDKFSMIYHLIVSLRIVFRFIWRRLFYFKLNWASVQLKQRKIAIFWIILVVKYRNRPFVDHPKYFIIFYNNENIYAIYDWLSIFFPKDCTRLYPFAWDNQWHLKSRILIDKLFLMEFRCFYSRYENELLA